MSSPPGVAFDFGRTLVDIGYPAAGLRRAGLELLSRMGLRDGRPDAASVGPAIDATVDRLISEEHRADPLREVEIVSVYRRALAAELGIGATAAEAAVACQLMQEPWAAEVRVRSGALESLAALRAEGARLGLLSNAPYPPASMHRLLERSGLSAHLQVALFSSELGVRKPAASAFESLASGMGLDPGSIWFVGDEWEADILGARAAGLRPLLSPGADPPPERGVAPRLRSFTELVARWREEAGGYAGGGSPPH